MFTSTTRRPMPRSRVWTLPMRPTPVVYGYDKPRPWRGVTGRTSSKSGGLAERRQGHWPDHKKNLRFHCDVAGWSYPCNGPRAPCPPTEASAARRPVHSCHVSTPLSFRQILPNHSAGGKARHADQRAKKGDMCRDPPKITTRAKTRHAEKYEI